MPKGIREMSSRRFVQGVNGAYRRVAMAVLAVAAVIAGLAFGAGSAQAATPTILNTGNWLESTFSLGETNNSANRVFISLAVKHDPGREVNRIKIDDDWDGNDNTTSKTAKTVTAQQPDIAGGYDHSRINFNYQFPTSGTGMSCGAFGVGGTNKATKPIRIRAVLDNGEETATSSKDIIFTRADCSGGEDFPYIYQRSQSATSVTPGSSVTFTYRGDDSDSTGNADFAGVNWRMRRVSDGTTTTPVKQCYSSPFDNVDKTLNVTFPDRGRWIVEAELLNNSGCNINNNAGSWAYIGAVDVNTAAATSPTASLAATRPQIGGNSTVTATFADGADSSDGGRVQNVEWDLDNNTTNGVGGYEVADLGTWNTNLSSPRSKTVNTAGMTPGLKTVRVRVGDNGALVGADNIRRTKVATATYLVDTPPVATGQTVGARSGTPKQITLEGTDVDDDSLTFTIATQPAHGTISGSGSAITYTADADYSGPDSFTFTANDGYGGTDTATVNVDVAPSTSIDEPTPTAIAVDQAEFSFSSQVAGATFECRLDPGEDSEWEACESPYSATGLTEGAHIFQVRSTVNGVTDPSPAEHTLNVYLTPPVTTIDGGPQGPTAALDPTFTFSSDVPGSTFECLLDTGDVNNQWEDCSSPKSYEDLIDGVYTFGVRATDPAGNVEVDPPVRNFILDNTAPDTAIDSAPPAKSNQAAATFEFSASEAGAAFECRMDGSAWDDCESPAEYTDLAEGSHTFEVRAMDELGNRDGSPASHEWEIDLTDPAVTITSGPAVHTTETDLEFEFGADEEVTFECSLDDGPWEDCESPAALTVDEEGAHSFQVRGTDQSGNVGLSPVLAWNLDLTAPETTIDSGPATLGNQADVEFSFSSDEAGATFECRIDSTDDADWQSCASPAEFTGLADGAHTFEVRAIDQAGNVDQSPVSYEFEIDTVRPGVTIDVNPAVESNSPNASFEFSSDDADATFECRLDGAEDDSFEACESPRAYLSLDAGQHRFEVRAVDPAGNRSQAESFEWTIDVTAPVTSITARPADPTQNLDATFEFDADKPGTTFECRIDSTDEGDWEACDSPAEYTGLSEERHTFEVRGTDHLGNVATTPASWSWTIDRTKPVAQFLTTPGALSNQERPEFTFDADEAAAFECRIDSSDDADWESCESPHQTAALGEGEHSLDLRATDAAGNVGDPVSHQWTVDLTAPVASIDTKPAQFTNQTTATFELGTDDADAAFECRLGEGDWETCASPAEFEDLTEGEHTFRVRAIDLAGNTGPADSYTWRIILTPPSIAIDQGPNGTVNSVDANFAFSSNDAQAEFECRIDSDEESDWESCVSPEQYTGLTEGDHVFEVRAIDGLGNISSVASREWSIDVTAPVATIDVAPESPSNAAAAEFEFSADDAGATFECSLDGAAFADCNPPKELTGLDEGEHVFRVRATDTVGNVGQAVSHTWQVDLTKPVVTIGSAPAQLDNSPNAAFEFSADEAAEFECRIDSDEDADWQDCDSPWGIADLVEGDHRAEVRATDAAGNVSDIRSHEWSIDLTDPVTTIDSAPPALTNQDEATFAFSSDDAGATFECRVDSSQADAWDECESPRELTGLSHGQHVFEVRATDEAGNTGEAAIHEWTVDLDVPTTTITATPAVLTNQTSAVFEFSSNDADADLECRIDGQTQGDWADCASPAGYSGLVAGDYTFRVRATDAAGNIGQQATFGWTVDLTAPEVTIESGPQGDTNATGAEFEFGSDKAGTTFECRIDSNDDDDWQACASPVSYSALDDGAHRFEVRGTDPAGNATRVFRNWTIDTTKPVATISAAPDALTSAKTAAFEFSADKAGATFECRIDSDENADWEACESGKGYTGLEDGGHLFELRPTDSLGNVGDVVTHEWTVDTVAPEVTIQTGPQQTTSQKTAEFAFTADKAGSTFECRVDGDGQDGWEECDSGVSYTALGDGDHLFEVRATDAIGNLGQAAEWSWTVDSVVPVATINSGPEGPVNTTAASFAFDADRTVAGYECRVDSEDDSAWEACESPFSVQGLDDGQHRFQVRAIGTISGNGPVASRAWTVDTVAPGVTLNGGPANRTRETGARFEFASDEAGAALSCRLDSSLPGDWQACESPRSISGLPDGAHTFEVRAVDAAGNAKIESHEWTVDTVAPVVTITKKPDASTKEQTATFEFTADKQGATFECAVDGGAWKACASPATTGQLAVGNHSFAVRATDGLGNASQPVSHSWNVTETTGPGPVEPAKPPVINLRKKAKLNRAGKAVVATVFCAEGTCTVKGPKKIRVKAGKRKYRAKVMFPKAIAAPKLGSVRVKLPKAALKGLGKRKLTGKVKLTVTSSNGKTVVRTIKLKLRAPKGGKKK